MKFLKLFLPQEYRAMITLATRITSSFDSKDDARKFFEVVGEALKDGKISVGEWSRIGSKAGIFKQRKAYTSTIRRKP
jgi:hypothetical protein